jgi:hypothetical protein
MWRPTAADGRGSQVQSIGRRRCGGWWSEGGAEDGRDQGRSRHRSKGRRRERWGKARPHYCCTTLQAFSKNPLMLSEKAFPDLYRSYPALAKIRPGSEQFEEFVRNNPKFLDDASLTLYQRRPALFAEEFSAHRMLALYPERFGEVVHDEVSKKNALAVAKLLEDVSTSLARKGISPERIKGMQEKALDKLIEKELSQHIDKVVRGSNYKVKYKSGTLSFSGEVGHFEFEQEISLPKIVKTIVIGGATISAYHVVWNQDAFVQVHACAGQFCSRDLSSKSAVKEAVPAVLPGA